MPRGGRRGRRSPGSTSAPAAEVAAIVERVGADRLFAISGLAPNPIFGLCKLLWHRRHRPEAFARTVKWLNVADYLAWRLCGEMATDYSLACRLYALDIATLDWSDEVLGAMEVDASLMAPLAASGLRLGSVSAQAAAATGLPRGCAVAVGGHDHVVGALAADAMRPGVLLCSTGTTEAQVIGLAAPARNPELGRCGYSQGVIVVDAPVWFAVGGLPTAGAAIEWFRGAIAAGADYATLIEEAEAVPPGSLGAGFLPQLRLGTPPHPDHYARGAFFGLSTDITRGCLFRALLEGMAADTRSCELAMAGLAQAPPPDVIRVIGGLTRNPLYMRIKASFIGQPITVVELPDAVAMGAALLAGIGAGVYRNLADAQARMRRDERVVQPDPAEHAFYRRYAEEVHAPAYPQLRPVHEAARRLLAGEAGELAQHVLGDLEVVLERAQRRRAALLQLAVIGAHRLGRRDLAVDQPLHQRDQRERVLGEIDLAAEQHEPGTAALRRRQQLEGVARRAGAAAEDADDDASDRRRPAPPAPAGRCRRSSGTAAGNACGTAAITRTMLSLTNAPISARLSLSAPTLGLNTSRKCLKPQRSASIRNSR